VIAASATVSHPERQLQHLYQRKIPAVQFPHPGPRLYESFYAAPVEPTEPLRQQIDVRDVETRSQQARIYAAILTNGRPHTTTVVAVLAELHLTLSRLMIRLTSEDLVEQNEARAELRSHISPGPLQEVLRGALDSTRSTASQLATVVDLHRIVLTYVTNKKGGDQILAAEEAETHNRHRAAGIPFSRFKTALITGSIEQGQIGETVEEAQRRPLPGQPFDQLADSLRSIVATSAISHGVDIDELNSMCFAGLPSDIAEYIQASSRVGRTHVGFCLLVPTPQRRRDRYVVEVFDSFHRFLERMVQPAAIDRWAAKAIERAIPSIFQAYLCGVRPTVDLLIATEDRKLNVPDMSFASDVAREYRRDGAAFVNRLVAFAERAIGLTDSHAPTAEEFYRNLLQEKLTDLLRDISSDQVGATELRKYFTNLGNSLRAPMTSLRDVDRAGIIQFVAADKSSVSPDEMSALMDFIQHGVPSDGADTDEDLE
jgi:hypothetical protein